MAGPSERASLQDLSAWRRASAGTHLLVSVALGALVGIPLALTYGWVLGGLVAWVVAGSVFLTWTWVVAWPLTARDTARLAQREDPSRTVRDLVLLSGAAVSVLVVSVVIFRPHESGPIRLAVGVACVVASWAVLHTIYTLTYARLYYTDPVGGVDFKQEPDPTYRDFAYLAFTIGMTFQVSDTDVGKASIRTGILRHALLSFVFDVVILAIAINVVAGLSK